MSRHPSGLLILILYKTLTALILTTLTITLQIAAHHHNDIAQFALAPHRAIITFFLTQFLRLPPTSITFATTATFLYGAIALLEAIGLWYYKAWARWLVLISVGLSIPIEIFELYHHMTGLKWLLFIINLLIFWYILKRFPSQQHH